MTHPIEAWALANIGTAQWIGAMGTAGALAFIAWEVTRSSRDQRRRIRAVLRSQIKQLEALDDLLEKVGLDLESGHRPRQVANAIGLTGLIERTSAQLAQISVADVPDPEAVDGYLRAAAALHVVDRMVKFAQDGHSMTGTDVANKAKELRAAIGQLQTSLRRHSSLADLLGGK